MALPSAGAAIKSLPSRLSQSEWGRFFARETNTRSAGPSRDTQIVVLIRFDLAFVLFCSEGIERVACSARICTPSSIELGVELRAIAADGVDWLGCVTQCFVQLASCQRTPLEKLLAR